MYASDVTNRKRNQVIYSDISRQKSLLDKGSIMRINYQKGGNDYAYMMELEKGCINNTCIGNGPMYSVNGNYVTDMDLAGATYINPSSPYLIEYGYQLPPNRDTNGNFLYPPGSTRDDAYFPIPMYETQFYFFGVLQTQMYWSTNCAILFRNPGVRVPNIPGNSSYLNTTGFNNRVNLGSPLPAILLGNADRRLDNLYVKNESIPAKFSILTIFVFYEDYTSQLISTPNTGQYRVRLIRELTGDKKQWIEVSVKVAPTSSGYIAGQIDTDGNPVDPTKLSPYNITDGNSFTNICGTTYSTVAPAAGKSFTFMSNSQGFDWSFRENSYVPI